MTARQPYDVYARLEDPVGVLSVALGQWEDRDETKAQPEVRRAANTAMDAIDGMLAGLHAMRARLVSEIRAADDANAARVDALLAEGRTYTHPSVFTTGIAAGWAEAETDPARIGWPARQCAAAIPFEVVDGRPVNPCASTGIRHGRNELGLWGENLMADALVTVTCGHYRYLLMVERGDGYGWAVPGGAAEPGETGLQTAVRELAEETGLALSGGETFRALAPRYVPDPRASDEAWAVTVPVHVGLGGSLLGLPHVKGGDDARRAGWIRAGSYEDLAATLREVYGGQVFAAHSGMLREFLGGES